MIRPTAYYNEHDPEKAAWLRELIRRDLIASGNVDERDIRDVVPAELVGYHQCHFFAGIGVWSYALRQAGWPDGRCIWTGSCPCQPFSEAGRGGGFADERHLWPAWFHLIGQCRPPVVLGEQVASAGAKSWIDLVHDDLEALGYAFGPIVLPAAGFGAPHGRHRIWFVADAEGGRRPAGIGYAHSGRDDLPTEGRTAGRPGPSGRMADTQGDRFDQQCREARGQGCAGRAGHAEQSTLGRGTPGERPRPGPVNGLWRDADWLLCRDGRWRPVEPGTYPLAHGAPARVGRLRGYGDAIVAPVAEAVIRAYLDSLGG